jgi:hypothetical protein
VGGPGGYPAGRLPILRTPTISTSTAMPNEMADTCV